MRRGESIRISSAAFELAFELLCVSASLWFSYVIAIAA